MRIVCWNVNSIRVRMDRLKGFLEQEAPDALCLQETKIVDADFPHEAIAEVGYVAAVHGQKTYNGVAILSKEPATDVRVGLDDGEDDPQARLIAATVSGVRVISAYVPNGSDLESDKYPYKLRWMERLQAYLERHHSPDEPLALTGDFNVAFDELDIAKPERWEGGVLTSDAVRSGLGSWMEWGLADVFRDKHPEGHIYSWWDYRRLAFPKNDGLRIDYVLATKGLAERCTNAEIARYMRKGEKPSDHAPVIADFEP